MFSDRKDKESLPDLPPLKTPFNLADRMDDELDDERNALPSFPDSPNHNSFSQAAIKDAVSGEEELPDVPGGNVVEMEEWSPENVERIKHPPEMDEEPSHFERIGTPLEVGIGRRNFQPAPAIGRTDVFVKLDKFHSAKRTLAEVRDKLEEIDEMIRKVREVKLREEQEISLWEKDLLHAKSRIQEISDNIFDKVG